MPITDSQVHIWEVDRPDRPWPPNRNPAQLPNGFSAEQMLEQMDAAGVDRAVIVPPTYVGEMNDTAIEASQAYPKRFAVMGRFDPQAPHARETLAGWLSQPHMLGIRMTFRIPPFNAWLDDGTLDWFFADCERRGIPLMLLLPGLLDRLAAVAARHPGLTLIVDHMGVVPDSVVPEAFDKLHELEALARFQNVWVKTSSAPCFSREAYPFADLYPYLKRIYDAFGPRRLMWGADFTRLRGTYTECLRHFQEGLDFLTEEDKPWILGGNLAEALNWPEA
ncbi:MAG TPA: amidohydrolase family protein [Dehalococcoidia bacterium]|nr:amidohydrolase family protein [Dehalococcoidia bacterium]